MGYSKIQNNVWDKFQDKFSYRVTRMLRNPMMPDWKDATHFRILIKNKKTTRSATFYYSQGLGHKDTSSRYVIMGLFSSLLSDDTYDTIDDMLGLGYDAEDGRIVLKNIMTNKRKVRSVGLGRFFKSLSQEELGVID